MMISIVICTRNRPAMLARCLNRLIAQEGNYEVIIVDQSDERYIYKIDKKFHRIKDLQRGLSRGRNIGIKIAKGDVIAFIDDDAIPEQRYLSILERSFLNDKTLGAVAGRILNLENDKPYSRIHGCKFKLLKEQDWQRFMGGNFALTRKAIEKIGLFDERFGAGCKWGSGEESDLFFRLIYNNVTVAYLPDLIVRHPCEITEFTLKKVKKKLFKYGRGQGALVAHHIIDYKNSGMLLHLLLIILKPCLRIFQNAIAFRLKKTLLYVIIMAGKCLGFIEFAYHDRLPKRIQKIENS